MVKSKADKEEEGEEIEPGEDLEQRLIAIREGRSKAHTLDEVERDLGLKRPHSPKTSKNS